MVVLVKYGYNGVFIIILLEMLVGEVIIVYLCKFGVDILLISCGGKYLGMYFLENGFGVCFGRVIYIDRLGSSFNIVVVSNYDMLVFVVKVDVFYLCGIMLVMNEGVCE